MSDAAVCAGAEEVLERYAATVFAAAYAMVKNKEDAEDIAQEVFISYVKAKPAFESAEHEKAWLLRVTINKLTSDIGTDNGLHYHRELIEACRQHDPEAARAAMSEHLQQSLSIFQQTEN